MKKTTTMEQQQPLYSQQQYQQPVIQPQSVTQQPAATIVTQNPQPSDDKLQARALSQMRRLSVVQLLMGILCVIFGIVLIALQRSFPNSSGSFRWADISYGIWIGAYSILLGGIDLRAVKSNTSRWITSAMVLNIISFFSLWVVLLSFSFLGILNIEGPDCSDRHDLEICDSNRISKTSMALNSLMVIMAIAELVISIWTAVLCCGAVCRSCKKTHGQVVSYNNGQMQTQQPVMSTSGVPAANPYAVYPNNAQPGGQTQFIAQPMVMQQQPVDHAQPQGPPSYSTVTQSVTAENPLYEKPPPTAYPTKS